MNILMYMFACYLQESWIEFYLEIRIKKAFN